MHPLHLCCIPHAEQVLIQILPFLAIGFLAVQKTWSMFQLKRKS